MPIRGVEGDQGIGAGPVNISEEKSATSVGMGRLISVLKPNFKGIGKTSFRDIGGKISSCFNTAKKSIGDAFSGLGKSISDVLLSKKKKNEQIMPFGGGGASCVRFFRQPSRFS